MCPVLHSDVIGQNLNLTSSSFRAQSAALAVTADKAFVLRQIPVVPEYLPPRVGADLCVRRPPQGKASFPANSRWFRNASPIA